MTRQIIIKTVCTTTRTNMDMDLKWVQNRLKWTENTNYIYVGRKTQIVFLFLEHLIEPKSLSYSAVCCFLNRLMKPYKQVQEGLLGIRLQPKHHIEATTRTDEHSYTVPGRFFIIMGKTKIKKCRTTARRQLVIPALPCPKYPSPSHHRQSGIQLPSLLG